MSTQNLAALSWVYTPPQVLASSLRSLPVMPENLIKPKEFLLVEDNEDDAEHAKRVLEQLGLNHPVRWLQDGATARSYLSSIENFADAPAILLLDLKLPFISGFEVLKSLRGNALFDRTLLRGSGRAQIDVVVECPTRLICLMSGLVYGSTTTGVPIAISRRRYSAFQLAKRKQPCDSVRPTSSGRGVP